MGEGSWLQYAGKRVIVSGFFSGIGQATARQLLDLGAEVHGLDRQISTLPLASFTQTDLGDPASINAATAGLTGTFDALFNCAGIPPGAPPLTVVKVNYLGTRHLTDSLLARLNPGSGIVTVSSNGGLSWPARLAALRELEAASDFVAGVKWCEAHRELLAEGYRFSKEALIVWTLASAEHTIKRQIRSNCVLPGAVQTPMLVEIEKQTPAAAIDVVAQPIGRRSTPDEQAACLLFLGSPRASYVNGAALPVDGGFMAGLSLSHG